MKFREKAKFVCFSFLSILISLMLLEFTSYTIFNIVYNEKKIIKPDEELGWTFTGFRYQRDLNFFLSFNNLGIRDDSIINIDELNDRKTVLVLGDSVVLGEIVPLEETFTKLLETKFRQKDRAWYFINAGMAGYNLKQEVIYYQRTLQKIKPKYVLLILCPNDLGWSEDMHDRYIKQTYRENIHLPSQIFFENLYTYKLLKQFIKQTPIVREASPDDYYLELSLAQNRSDDPFTKKYLKKLKEVVESNDGKLVVAISPVRAMAKHKTKYSIRDFNAFNIVNHICNELGIEYISSLDRIDDLDMEFFADSVHLSKLGHIWFSNLLYAKLSNIIL